jgi:hypothetical protein
MRGCILDSDGLLVSRDLGAVAQLGERLICIQEVAGSIPTSSTSGNQLRADGIRETRSFDLSIRRLKRSGGNRRAER